LNQLVSDFPTNGGILPAGFAPTTGVTVTPPASTMAGTSTAMPTMTSVPLIVPHVSPPKPFSISLSPSQQSVPDGHVVTTGSPWMWGPFNPTAVTMAVAQVQAQAQTVAAARVQVQGVMPARMAAGCVGVMPRPQSTYWHNRLAEREPTIKIDRFAAGTHCARYFTYELLFVFI
jgi:hypothetical protein